jgi:hypothetical protein
MFISTSVVAAALESLSKRHASALRRERDSETNQVPLRACISACAQILELAATRRELLLQPDIAHVVFASRRGLLPSVRALIDFLAERFSELEDD